SRFMNEGAELLDPFFRFEIEIDTRMETTLSEMAVEIPVVFVAIKKLPEMAQIIAQFFRRHRRIFPSFPCRFLAWHKCSCAKSRFTNSPDLFLVFLIWKEFEHHASLLHRIHAAARSF